jgi:hypothetical protein
VTVVFALSVVDDAHMQSLGVWLGNLEGTHVQVIDEDSNEEVLRLDLTIGERGRTDRSTPGARRGPLAAHFGRGSA